VKLFYTGPFINAEMLVAMLDKHGIAAMQSFVDSTAPDDGDLSRPPKSSCRNRITTAPINYFTPSAKTNFDRKNLAQSRKAAKLKKIKLKQFQFFAPSRLCARKPFWILAPEFFILFPCSK
jgi:hypothetical protein